MYLLAIKSFVLYMLANAVFVLSDGTLTEVDERTLQRHIPGAKMLSI